MNTFLWSVFILFTYSLIGILFLFAVRKRLTNGIYTDLTLFYYNWSPKVKSFYPIYMRSAVFIFWPLFLVALIVDLIIEYFSKKEEEAIKYNNELRVQSLITFS